ncbi:MAG: L-fucose/L-arabinose isomerase family protein [Firmicutes bacterium]|nr:L-fucose/L-arabinose isomerase family protein [Bacillota bacterium]
MATYATRLTANRHKIKLGYAPTRRNIFSKEDAAKYKRLTEEKLKGWGIELITIDWLNEEGLLYDAADAPKIAQRFKEENVDAVFSPHCNFGTEDAVAKLAKIMGKPFLLWGPRDEAPLPDGMRLRDTQCGLFATSKILRRLRVPFTYIVNSRLNDPVFERGVKNFLAASAVVKAFRNLRIGQISTRPAAFWTVMVNEGELLERFGIEIVPISLVEIVNSVNSRIAKNDTNLKTTVEEFKGKVEFHNIDDEIIKRIAALKLTMEEWATGEGCSAIAIQCWSALQDALGIMPCFANAELTDAGLPVVCETDIHGAVSAIMAQAARMGETPIFFADLTIRHPDNDNAELIWHCGPFPLSLKAENSPHARVDRNYTQENGCPGVCEWQIRGGDITITRFDGDGGQYSLLMGHGRGVDGPMTRGTYVWVEVNDWPKWEEKFIKGPYIHHVACVHGNVAPVLYEATRYIPGLKADPVDPGEEEIAAWLRGEG